MQIRRSLALSLSLFAAACGGDGKDGSQGPAGAQGPAGSDGTDGTNGTNGSNGTQGPAGPAGPEGPAGTTRSLSFTGINVATTTEEKGKAYASPSARIDGKEVTLSYVTELRSGAQMGDAVFGRMIKKDGNPVKATDGSDFISPSNDFSSLIKVDTKIFEITHFETTPATMYLSELDQDAAGKLTVKSTKPIDFSSVEGLWTPCAGSVSPWNTHLGSEEYPSDARVIENATTVASWPSAEKDMLRYWGLDAATATVEQAKAAYNPYRYGYIVEVSVDQNGAPTVKKHYTAGRRALELSYVMPDQKTVYLTDDGTNDGFYMFVAKTAGDLSEGTLYAARWFQTSPAGAGNGRADLYWIQLGPADVKDADVKAIIDGGTKFSDIFEVEAQNADGSCPSAASGFKAINVDTGRECLRLKTGQELAASRFETRRYAAYLGATTEFRKSEGITFNPEQNRLYVAFSELNNGTNNNHASRDLGGPNHIQLAQNDCGAVYEFVLSPNAAIGSSYVAESTNALVEGVYLSASGYPSTSPYFDDTATIGGSAPGNKVVTNVCSVSGIANPDNISFIPGYNTLLIGEDTTNGHQNDVVWAYNLDTRELTRIFSTPYGSETTGVYWYPNLGGHGYIKAQIQHPYGESDEYKSPDATAKASYTGYIGPFPAMDQ